VRRYAMNEIISFYQCVVAEGVSVEAIFADPFSIALCQAKLAKFRYLAAPEFSGFCILTAARSGEVLGATWSEFDLDRRLWTRPACRMKAGIEHAVPLPDRAVEILRSLGPGELDAFGFPGARRGRPLSNMSMGMLLRRMKADVTTHGFRSSFRDWCGNETSYARKLAEEALAHSIGDAVERAYRRQQAIERRRELMAAWARFVDAGSTVVRLRKAPT
jgi:integrase